MRGQRLLSVTTHSPGLSLGRDQTQGDGERGARTVHSSLLAQAQIYKDHFTKKHNHEVSDDNNQSLLNVKYIVFYHTIVSSASFIA